MEVDYTWSQSTPSQILVVPKHQSHPLHFYHNDKNNVRFDSRSEPYLPRCRTEDPDPDPDEAHLLLTLL